MTGDTKVVGKGSGDKVFINTSGIGVVPSGVSISGDRARPGDAVLGFDPLYVANEGKLVAIVPPAAADAVLAAMRAHPLGKGAVRLGNVTEAHPGLVVMRTGIGGSRILERPYGELLPRIC